MGPSDFRRPFIVGLRPWTSRRAPWRSPPRVGSGSPGSRVRWFHACEGSATAQDLGASRAGDAQSAAFRYYRKRRRPGGILFRGSIPRLHVPLSTLRRRLRRRLRMTRGRCGSLLVATPSPCDSFIHCTSPVYPGAPIGRSSSALQRRIRSKKYSVTLPLHCPKPTPPLRSREAHSLARQPRDGLRRRSVLHERDERAQHDDRADDDRVRPFAHEPGDQRRPAEQSDQRTAQLCEERRPEAPVGHSRVARSARPPRGGPSPPASSGRLRGSASTRALRRA